MALKSFLDCYAIQLENSIRQNPTAYSYGVDKIPEVVSKIREELVNKTYNKEGLAFKATCRCFGLKHTYKAINDFIKG